MYRVREQKTYRTWNELTENEKRKLLWESSISDVIDEEIRFDVESAFGEILREACLPEDLHKQWSLSCCQGDGCSVTGSVPITLELLYRMTSDEKFPAIRKQLESGHAFLTYCIGSNSNHYVHPMTMRVELEDTDLEDIPDDDLDELGDVLLEYLRYVCRDVESAGYRLIDHLHSDETISELCEANGVLFDEFGRAHWGLAEEFETDTERFTDIVQVAV